MHSIRRGLLILLLAGGGTPAGAQVPALIQYQGRLLNGTNLYNGPASIVFRLRDIPSGEGVIWYQDSNYVTVVDGLYTAVIGDDPTAPGDMSWTRANGAFYIETVVNGVALSPRERVLSVAYAITAGGVTNGAISTMMIAEGAVTGSHLGNNAVDSAKIQDGSISFTDISQNSAGDGQIMKWNGSAWVPSDDNTGGGGESLLGYAEYGMFTPSPNAGGTDVIAMGKGCRAGGMNSVVGGGAYNAALGAENAVVAGGAFNTNAGGGAVIGGGMYNYIAYEGSNAVVAGGWSNVVEGYKAAVGGGQENRIQIRAAYSVISGGQNNLVGTGSYACAIAAGTGNRVQPGIYQGFIGAGGGNRLDDGDYGFIGAGMWNWIAGGASWAVVGGGRYNVITNNADYAAIPGGYSNVAAGAASFAAGRGAQALHAGAFVWNGSTSGVFGSTAAGQFLVNAPGGAGIGAAAPRGALDVAGRTYSRGITIEDEAFLNVTTTSNEWENGLNLLSAYALARTAAPHNQPLSASNRMAVLVPPGRYNLETNSLVLDTEYVDLVGLSSVREEQLIFGDGGTEGVLRQTANDARVENLHFACIRSGGGSRVAYHPDSDLAQTVVRNCRFSGEGGSGDAMPWSRTYAGTYVDCVSGDASFGSGSDGVAAGTFIRCEAGEDSFGGYQGLASGTFVDCSGSSAAFGGFSGAASGLFVRCRGGVFSFGGGSGGNAAGRFEQCVSEGWSFGGGGGEASGVFIGCLGGQGSFGSGNPGSGVASGYFLDCQGGDSSFGSHYGSEASGTFIHCVGGALSFACDGYCSGVFINCTAGSFSFGGNQDGTLSGSLYNCVMAGSEWQAPSPSKITGRLENCSWGAAVTIQSGARLYNSTFRGAITGSGAGDCRLASVRCTALNLGSLSNLIATPYNVVDSDLD